MSSRRTPSVGVLLAVLLGAIVALLALFLATGTGPAGAQTATSPVAEEFRLSPEEKRVLDNSRFRTASPEQAKSGPARRAWTRALAKGAPRAVPVLARAGLAPAAGGIWGRNLIVLKTAVTGDTFYIGADFDAKLAEGAHVVEGVNWDGVVGTRGVVASVDWRMQSREEGCTSSSYRCSVTSEVKAYREVQNLYCNRYDQCQGYGGIVQGLPASSLQLHTDVIHSSAVKTTTFDPVVSKKQTAYVPQGDTRSMYVADASDRTGPGLYRFVTDLCTTPGCTTKKTFSTFDVGQILDRPGYVPQDGDVVLPPEEVKAVVDALQADNEYKGEWEKPWLSDDFRAPSDPQEREALWGPVVSTWTTPSGECKEFQSGAKLCDSPNGSTFAWVVKDYTAWLQDSAGGKETRLRPTDRPPDGGSGNPGDGWGGNGGNGEHIPYEKAEKIAQHAIASGHEVPGLGDISSPYAPLAYTEYVYDVGKKINPHVFVDGTKMFYVEGKDAVVFYNPGASSNEGTIFVPRDRTTGESRGLRYYLEQIQQGRASQW